MRFVRCRTTSEYEAMILTPEQAYAILLNLREPERTLTLLAAGTGLRISECLGLQWQDVCFAEAVIHVRRTWTCRKVGWPKSKASKGPVPLHPLLAEFMFRWKQKTPYFQPGNWVFPSFRLKGSQPLVGNMLVEDYLRPAAVKVGILSSHRDDEGRLVDDDPRRFGFHNLRHSLASFLVRIRTDPKTVQTLLRHEPQPSYLGLAVLASAAVVMPWLAQQKRRLSAMTNSPALRADAAESALCGYLSSIALAGIGLNAIWRIGWADAAAALIIVPLIVREGFQSMRGRTCDCY